MKTFNLYDKYYQPATFEWLAANVSIHQETALLLPTGSGKTTLILSFLAWNFAQTEAPFSEVYVAAPQLAIIEPFRAGHGNRYRLFEDGLTYPLMVPGDFKNGALDSYIQGESKERCWFVGTHQTLALKFEALPQWARVQFNLKGKLLIVDEGHHAHRDTRLAAFIAYWLAHGGHVLYATATPKNALHGGVEVYEIPLVELMENACAPTSILSQFVDTGLAEDTAVSGVKNVPKTANDEQMSQAFKKMVQLWVKDGRPKLIVRIKPTRRTSDNVRLLHLARQAFEAEGAKVIAIRKENSKTAQGSAEDCDEIGDCEEPECDETLKFKDSEELLKVLGRERERKNYSESECDVIVTMNTMIEGADWPFCSHVYLWGVPDSYPTILQILGRTLRSRLGLVGYPTAWVSTSKIAFFVGGVSDSRSVNGRHMLVVGCSLASYAFGSQWSTFREEVKLVRAHPKLQAEMRRHITEVPDERKEEIRLISLACITSFNESFSAERYRRLGDTFTTWQFAERKRVFRTEVLKNLTAQEQVYAKEVFVGQDQSLRSKYIPTLTRHLDAGQGCDDARSHALDALLDEFLALTTLPCGMAEDLEQQGVLQLTAPVLKQMTKEMYARCPPTLYLSRVRKQTKDFIKAHPNMSCEELMQQQDPQGHDSETFATYDRAARQGSRGLDVYPDGLASLVCEKYDDWVGLIQNLVMGHLQTKVSLKRVVAEFRHHPLGFFYGEVLADIVAKFGEEFCAKRLTMWQAVQIGRARWTSEQRVSFIDSLKTKAVQEAIDGLKG